MLEVSAMDSREQLIAATKPASSRGEGENRTPATFQAGLRLLEVNQNAPTDYFLSVGAPGKIPPQFIATALDLPGFVILRSLGVARGITVRSRNICAAIAGVLCSLAGGRNMFFVQLCEHSRDEALQLMVKNAESLGGNAIIGFRFESHDIADGITEMLAYGTFTLS